MDEFITGKEKVYYSNYRLHKTKNGLLNTNQETYFLHYNSQKEINLTGAEVRVSVLAK